MAIDRTGRRAKRAQRRAKRAQRRAKRAQRGMAKCKWGRTKAGKCRRGPKAKPVTGKPGAPPVEEPRGIHTPKFVPARPIVPSPEERARWRMNAGGKVRQYSVGGKTRGQSPGSKAIYGKSAQGYAKGSSYDKVASYLKKVS